MQPVLLYPRRSRFAPKLCFADQLLKSIILYINPVLHGCQCFVLNPKENVKVGSKPVVMKYPLETCKISFDLNLDISSYLYSFLALSRSLFSSRRLMVSRLSYLRLPLAIAMVILAFPFWK